MKTRIYNSTVRTRLLPICLAVFATACAPAWRVVRESGPPSALANAGTLAVQFDYSATIVEGIAMQDWILFRTQDDAEYPVTFADLLSKFEDAYMTGLQNRWARSHKIETGTAAPEGEVVAHVRVATMELGKYIPFVLPATIVNSHVAWETGGQETDEIIIESFQNPSIMSPSVFSHIGPVGSDLGAKSGKFLNSRQPQ